MRPSELTSTRLLRRRSTPSVAALPLLAASSLLVATCSEPGGRNRGDESQRSDLVERLSTVLLSSPAGSDSLAPNLVLTPDGPLLSWLERVHPGLDRDRDAPQVAFRVAHLAGDRFLDPVTVTVGSDLFANWADFPSVATLPDGGLLAHWLRKLGAGTYAYGVALAGSSQDGEWTDWGWLHRDLSATEHGFVSFAGDAEALYAFWLDGRATSRGEPMSLRSRRLTRQASLADPGTVIDDRVCECCQTDAALTSAGPIVVYRNRTSEEVRDVWRILWNGTGWSEAAPVAKDGWTLHGCPVNGPAVAADGNDVAVAWFTAAGDEPKVQLALSHDGGVSFATPLLIDGRRPTGRLDVALSGGRAWVSWLGSGGDGVAVLLRPVTIEKGKATLGPIGEVASASVERASGFPRLLLDRDRLLVAWVEVGEESQVRVGSLPL